MNPTARTRTLTVASILLIAGCPSPLPPDPVDPCATDHGGCSASAECSNDEGRSRCTCLAGYQGDGVTCTDIDECATNRGGCDANATCANTPGSHTCTCLAGYQGDGVTCADIDECATNRGGCDANATCANTPGSHTCTCLAGYQGDGVTCRDIDECATNHGGCSLSASCQNTPGSHTCTCFPGFTGDGVTCTDIDECATNRGGCDTNATCNNYAGGFYCQCNQGYQGNGTTCSDVDECLTDNGGCSPFGICTNTVGSRTCSCPPPDFTGDGFTCHTQRGNVGGSMPPYPGVDPVLLDPDPADWLLVSPSEEHVALLTFNSSSSGCDRPGALRVVTALPGQPPVITQVSAGAIDRLVRFSDDSTRLAFVDGPSGACVSSGSLRLANADGTAAQQVATGVEQVLVAGTSVVFQQLSGTQRMLMATTLAGAPPVLLATAPSTFGFPELQLNRTGTAAAFIDPAGDIYLAPLGPSAPPPIRLGAATQNSWERFRWSPSGQKLAIVTDVSTLQQRLELIDPDGTGRATVTSACTCKALEFSPDESRLAYDVVPLGRGAPYSPDVVIQTLATGQAVTVANVADADGLGYMGWGDVFFSPDGEAIFAHTTWATRFTFAALYRGNALTGGAFGELISQHDFYNVRVAPSSDYVVAPRGGYVEFMPLKPSGSYRSVAVDAAGLRYEPVPVAPRLLVQEAHTYRLQVHSTDGSAPAVVLPGANFSINIGSWQNGRVEYEAGVRFFGSDYPFRSATDYALATADGATSGLLGSAVSRAVQRDSGRFLFFLRAPEIGGGLWRATLPP
ncbi:MAG TPA: EGF domain-containing protein [Myxococcaceae bacterium]|nr:EGF domain-containing protein [Myxococcaceae bacterium]